MAGLGLIVKVCERHVGLDRWGEYHGKGIKTIWVSIVQSLNGMRQSYEDN
jgi:hypothetical protein